MSAKNVAPVVLVLGVASATTGWLASTATIATPATSAARGVGVSVRPGTAGPKAPSVAPLAPRPGSASPSTAPVAASGAASVKRPPIDLTPPSISGLHATLPDATAGEPFEGLQLAASGTAVTWSCSGTLPPGMSLSPAGLYAGTPTLPGAYSFLVSAGNAGGADTRLFAQVVNAPGSAVAAVPVLQALGLADPTGASTVALARSANAKGLRFTPNVGWHGIEPVLGLGRYDWSNADAGQLAAQTGGLEPFRVLSSTRPEYNPLKGQLGGIYDDHNFLLPEKDPVTGEDVRAHYQQFVRDVVRRYYRTAAQGNPFAMPGLTIPVKRWSYTPEIATYWIPIVDPVQRAREYATMFQLTAEAIHDVDRTAEVFVPFNSSIYLAAFTAGFFPQKTIYWKGQLGADGTTQLTPADVHALQADSITFVTALVDGTRPDAYDLHAYGDPESIPAQRAWLLCHLAATKRPLVPVYSNEGGEPFASCGETLGFTPGPLVEDPARLAAQSSALVRHVALALASNLRSVTFNLSSEYGTSGATFGDLDLTDAKRQPRPAYSTYQLAFAKLGGATEAKELVAGLPSNLRLFRLTRPGSNAVWVAWDPTATGGAVSNHDLSALVGFGTARVTRPPLVSGQAGGIETVEPTAKLSFGLTPIFVEQDPGPPPPPIVFDGGN